jgi:DNA replicative helicase MCM subunit Mcm2 (Cdc46/Mcm family)
MSDDFTENQIATLEDFHSLIAPHILGNRPFKQWLALQLFSNPGLKERLSLIGIGDVSSGKTSIALDVKEMNPRAEYTTKDTTPAGMRLSVLDADDGTVFADEFEKYSKDTRQMLLEPMQQGTLTIRQARIKETNPARINVTALINPIGYLRKGISIIEQIPFFENDLPTFSRFHAIIPVESAKPDFYPDIALKIDNKYSEERLVKLRELVMEVKYKIREISVNEEIRRKIGSYVAMKKEIMPRLLKKTITPRIIEGMYFAIKARARMKLRTEAKKEDFDYVKGLYDELYKYYVPR